MDTQDPISTALDLAKTAKDVLPQTTQQTDGALATLVGWFNNVVLYPVKKANITYRYKLECFEDDLYNRTAQIPEQCIHEPNLMIAGPTLEALKYTFDEEKLREMFVNLLASSMDSRKDSAVHPSYVRIICQMNSFDAMLFKFLASQKGYIKAINPRVRLKGTDQAYLNSMPEWYIDWDPSQDVFQASASLIRLAKLGIVELMYDRTAGRHGYDELEKSVQLDAILKRYQQMYPSQDLEISATKSIVYVNDYGREFAETCL